MTEHFLMTENLLVTTRVMKSSTGSVNDKKWFGIKFPELRESRKRGNDYLNDEKVQNNPVR